MNVAFFVSADGFGHAARAAAVMSAMRRQAPDVILEVFTRVPEWFFSEALSAPVHHHIVVTDVGMVQKDPFVADIPATLSRLGEFLPFSDAMVQEMAAGLTTRGCRAVVCDISPLGIAVAKAAGVPSILVENFTWDWLYAPYRKAYPAFEPYMEMLASWFSAADIHIQTEPVCRPLSGVRPLHPVSRPAKNGAKDIRAALDIPNFHSLVLVTMGGVVSKYQFVRHLEKMPRVMFVLPHDVTRISRNGNTISLPHHSAFYHPDLVNAADLVVGKLGYSTLAEVGHAGKPFGYITRGESAESKVLADYAKRHVRGLAFSESDIASGVFIESLNSLLELESGPPAFPNDASKMAALILSAASGRVEASSVRALRSIDPFNDRTSRDVRNRLSEVFTEALGKLDMGPIRKEADALKDLSGGIYRDYIHDRVARYRRVMDLATAGRIRNPKDLAILVWNAGLFFECHEHLETLWARAEGAERRALQGLIKAAGVYVHRELGRTSAAERLSHKAVHLLESGRKQLAFIANLEELVRAINQNGAGAPELKGSWGEYGR